MKRAVVLSGGGAKGAYEIGVWKALRRLGIKYDIVTGTSVGALNGVLMVQDDYYKALKLWYYMDYNKVIDIEIKGKYSTKKGKEEILKKYAKGMISGGYELSGLEKVIDEAFDDEKFIKSSIDYGLVTTYFPSLKPKFIKKSTLKSNELKKYLLATASCFPAFKPTKIGNNLYIDGGYYDNLPINLAIDLGAEEVIAVDMGSIGLVKPVKNKDVKITYIRPRNDLGSFLAFEKDYSRIAINLGYNDTMKIYGMLEGNKYTFKKGSLKKNYQRISGKFYKFLDKYYFNSLFKIKYNKLTGVNKELEFNKILELTASVFSINPGKIYRTSLLNIIIKKEFLKTKIKSFNSIKTAIKNNNLKKAFVSKELVCYIYNELKNDEKRSIKRLQVMFPDAFLSALYLLSITN